MTGDAHALVAPVLAKLEADVAVRCNGQLCPAPVAHEERRFSHVFRFAVSDAAAGAAARHVFLKLTKPTALGGDLEQLRDRIRGDFAITTRVFESLADDEFGAVRPVGCYPDALAIATEEVPGVTLLQHLKTHGRWRPSEAQQVDLDALLARLGRWIRHFQSIERGVSTESIDEIRDYIDHRIKRLVQARAPGFSDADRQRFLDHIARLGRAIPEPELGPTCVHGDLALGNVLVYRGRITVLDFAMSKPGNRLLDVTRVFVQLDQLSGKVQFRRRTIARLQQALLRGFDASLDPGQPLFRLMVLLHRINHIATLTLNDYSLAERLYNRRILDLHRTWIAADLERGLDPERP